MSGIVTEGKESFDGGAGSSSMEGLSSRQLSHLSCPVEEVPSTKHIQKGMRTLALDTPDHAPDAIVNSQDTVDDHTVDDGGTRTCNYTSPARFVNRRGRLRGGTMHAIPRIAKGHDAAGEIIVRGKPNMRQVVRVTRAGIPINRGNRAQPQDNRLSTEELSKRFYFCQSRRVARMLHYDYVLKTRFRRAFSELGGDDPEALLEMITETETQLPESAMKSSEGDVICTLEMVEYLIRAYHDGLDMWKWSYELHSHLVQSIEKLGGNPFDEERVTLKSVLELMQAVDFGVENDFITIHMVGLHLAILRQVWKEFPIDSYCHLMIPRIKKFGRQRQ